MTAADAAPPRRFAFAFDPRYRTFLVALGITPSRSWVSAGNGRLDARFGPWRLRTALANVMCAEVTGPYRAYRAIGPRISLADRGLSFGSNAGRGVCLRFREAVPGGSTLGLIRHPGLTVTVADVDGLAAWVGEQLGPAGPR